MENEKFNFHGWATKNDLKCSDGRIIRRDAFKHNDGETVPLVWNHDHTDPYRILGHAILENREEGVYAYCKFNDTDLAKTAQIYVEHGDITHLSIYANQLKQQGPNVIHGSIREVSLVMAGANPGACIESVIRHGEEVDEEGFIYTDDPIEIYHAEAEEETKETTDEKEKQDMSEKKDMTVGEKLATFSKEDQDFINALVGKAVEDALSGKIKIEETSEGGNENMKHNVFEGDLENENKDNVLSHSEMKAVIDDAKRYGSMRESALQHGITDIEYLFPDHKAMNNTPDLISRDMGWVKKVMGSVHHTPFSRIKSVQADITAEEARARGYIKGKEKKEEIFTLLKRTTDPQTIYKKQKLHRDDIVDITDFDVIAFLKAEMRMMLDEELARAILIGDGRLPDSDDKIKETCIRPVWLDTDKDLYAVKARIEVDSSATAEARAKAFIKAAIKNRKEYKGSGNPSLYCSEDILTDCLLLEDKNGRIIYDSMDKLATAMRVKEIVAVEPMAGAKRTDKDGNKLALLGLIVNLNDYSVGADKGGAVNMFDDFDIDYNAQKYLIETRCSGALRKPKSALVIEMLDTTSPAGEEAE